MPHFIVFSVYVIASALLSLQGAQWFDLTDSAAAILGLLVLALCGLGHEHWLRKDRQNRLELGFDELSRILGDLSSEQKVFSDQLKALDKKLKTIVSEKAEVDSVRREVEVLQDLVAQLSGAKGKRAIIKRTAKIAKLPEDKDMVLEMVRDGLRQDLVDLYLQPIVSLPQRKLRFYECFSRIRTKKGEIILPENYVKLAEKEGLIAAIDNMLLFRCIQLVRQAQKKASGRLFFINLSPYTLQDKTFFGDFTDFLRENISLAGSLVFEVSQTLLHQQDREIYSRIKNLCDTGAKLAVSDVTSLRFEAETLKDFRVEYIKIPQSVLKPYLSPRAGDDLENILKSLAGMQISVIAEKIEKDKDLVELLDYPIDYAQGYLLGEPALWQDVEAGV